MHKISVVIITYNEERNIGRCLDSVKEVADDIVVVDSFSTDKTPQICKAHNVNLIQREWAGYSATKNFANQQAQHDWILALDADEAFDTTIAEAFQKAKEREEPRYYKFNRITCYCGQWIRHSGWYPDIKFRSFDRRNTHWKGIIHEVPVMEVPHPVKRLKGQCLHYSFYNVQEHSQQARHFARLKAEDLYQKGKANNALKKYLSSFGKFLRIYLLKLGFLDGRAGWWIALISAKAVLWKYQELKRLYDKS